MTETMEEDRQTFTVQFIDGRKAALGGAGAEVHLYVDGRPQQRIEKHTINPIRIKFPRGHKIHIEARFEGHTSQRIEVGPGSSHHDFPFPGAGPPIVLIVCTKDCETIAVRATFDNYGEPFSRPNDSNIYRIGQYDLQRGVKRKVLLVSSGMGNALTSAVTTQALSTFPEIEHLLLVGIAGGCPNPAKPAEHVRLGDIVVPDHRGIVQYDNVKEMEEDKLQHRGHPQRPSARMIQAARELDAEGELGNRSWEAWIEKAALKYSKAVRKIDVLYDGTRQIEHPADPDRRAGFPRVHRGAIASADTLQKNPASRDMVRDKWDVRAIEMEGSGFETAGWLKDLDVMIIRGICDYSDGNKNDEWQPYASLAAAAYARAMIEILPEEWFP